MDTLTIILGFIGGVVIIALLFIVIALNSHGRRKGRRQQ